MKRLFADTHLLLSLRWQLAWNGFRRRTLGRKILIGLGTAYVVVMIAGLAGAMGYGGGAVLQHYPNLQLDALIPGAILTAVAVLLMISSFGLALSSLFLANDLELLMSAPVDRRAVFISKLLDGLAVSYGLVLVSALPALVTYGIGLHYGPLYYLLALVALVGTPLLPAGLGALLVMGVARFAPARRVREVLGFTAALVGMSCSLLGQTARVWSRNLATANTDPRVFLQQAQRLAYLPIPSLVAGRGLSAAGRGDLVAALGNLAGFLLLTFGFFAACIWLADSLYASGWVRMQSSGVSKRSKARAAHDATHSGWLGRSPAYLAIPLKDWRVIPRDLRNFAQLLWPLLTLPAIYVNLVMSGGRNGFSAVNSLNSFSRGRFDPSGIFVAIAILAGTALVFSQIASTAISMEGKSWYLLKIAPISDWELLRSKFLEVILPYAALSTVVMGVVSAWRGFSLSGTLYGWFGVELLGAGMLAISLGMGTRFAKLNWENPKQMFSGWASLLSFIGDAILCILAGSLLCAPLLAQVFAPELVTTAWAVGIVGAVVVTAGLAGLALSIGRAHLPSIGEM